MKRLTVTLFAIVLLFTFSSMASAQGLTGYGLKAGLNLANLGGEDAEYTDVDKKMRTIIGMNLILFINFLPDVWDIADYYGFFLALWSWNTFKYHHFPLDPRCYQPHGQQCRDFCRSHQRWGVRILDQRDCPDLWQKYPDSAGGYHRRLSPR